MISFCWIFSHKHKQVKVRVPLPSYRTHNTTSLHFLLTITMAGRSSSSSGRDGGRSGGRGRGRGRGRYSGRGRGGGYGRGRGGDFRTFNRNESNSSTGGDDDKKSTASNASSEEQTRQIPPPHQQQKQQYNPNIPRLGGDNGGTHSDLVELLRNLEGKQYPRYHDIESSTKGWVNHTDGYSLYIGRAQGDPFAKPTRCRVIVKGATAKFPPVSYQNKIRSVALGDFLNRQFYECCKSMGADVAVNGENGQGSGGKGWNSPKGGDIEVRYCFCF